MDFDDYHDQMIIELVYKSQAQPEHKDILIVVHDQLPYVRECLESIAAHTADCTIYVWDNGSRHETTRYLADLAIANKIVLLQVPTNWGFIIPNNRLFAMGTSPYVILVNSDVRVEAGWSEALLGYLQANEDVGIVGFEGCKLNSQGEGGLVSFGRDIDYVSGWCLCARRSTLEQIGLFDEENLEFAYGEDSDLSLRAKEQSLAVHALHLHLAIHHQCKTITAVHQEMGQAVQATFQKNHEYIRRRWAHVLPR